MMDKKQFLESQKECADMLGMSLSEYQKYCENFKVSPYTNIIDDDNNTDKILESLGKDKSALKVRKDY